MSAETTSETDLLGLFAQRRRGWQEVTVTGVDGRLALPALGDLIDQLEIGLFRWPYVQVVQNGAQVHPGRFTHSRRVMGTRVQGFVAAAQVRELMDTGCVVLMHSVEHWNGAFDSSLRAIAGPTNSRTYAAFGRPLRLSVEPDPGLVGAAIVPLPDSEPVRVQARGDSGIRTIEPDQVLLLSDAGVRTHRIVSDGSSDGGGVVVIALLRPTLDDALRAVAQHARGSADDVLTTRYHQWSIAERRRRAAALLVRTIDDLEAAAEGATS